MAANAGCDVEQWSQMWLPLWPLATDDFRAGVYRGSRDRARRLRYIEANPEQLHNLLVVDIHHGDAELRALSGPARPTAIVANPRNGHAHAVWALAEPVTTTEYGSRRATAYAASVVEGLRLSLDGDGGYSGLLTKNPEHRAWDTLWLADDDDLWTLGGLEAAIADHMPARGWRRNARRRGDVTGLGRNCAIFETARHWAYREVRRHWGDSNGLGVAIHANVATLNAEFAEPLRVTEARGIAASIHRWITTKSRMWTDGPAVYEATFTTIQAARGRKSGAKRRASSLVDTVLTGLEES